jgi:hypothetical protein
VLPLSYTYYQAEIGADNTDLYVIVTPYSGDPDLFVNLGKSTFPNTTSFDKFSNHYGGLTDHVVFHANQSPYCHNCQMNIAVWGFTDCFYSIMFANV